MCEATSSSKPGSAAFTPGPWTIEREGVAPGWHKDDSEAVTVHGHRHAICVVNTNDPTFRGEANARLTRPLDSWEPAEDCPLPVGGWKVVQQTFGERRWEIHNAIGELASNCSYDTRRAAYVWAWTEATDTDDAKPRLITGADVKVGQRWQSREWEYVDTITKIDGAYVYYDQLGRDGFARSGLRLGISDYVAWAGESARIITDGTGATDGPSDDRGVLGWAAFDELCKTVDDVDKRNIEAGTMVADRVRLVEREATALTARVAKVEGALARIGPMESFIQEAKALADRMTIVERLVAGLVPAITPGRNDAAAANALATDVAAADEGWREMLVPVSFTHEDSLMWWMTPDRKAYTGHCLNPSTDWGTFDSTLRDFVVVTDSRKDDPVYLAVRSKIAPPPNLAEWYKPDHVGDANTKVPVTAGELAARMVLIKQAENAVPPTYRVGDDLAAWVRNLASAHDTALKYQRELERKLGDANTAAVAADGRAATAVKRASKAEDELAELRAKLETALK